MRKLLGRLAMLLVLMTGVVAARAEDTKSTSGARVMVEIISQTGLCSVVVDDLHRIDLPLPTMEGPASGTFPALTPGRHRIVVKGFFTWHDRFVDVGPGEVLEIHVEPGSLSLKTRSGC
jgi:hypothetical protein